MKKIEKIINYLFLIGFFGIMIIPALFTNFKDNTVSVAENRMLANKPQLFIENEFNSCFLEDAENWFNDNIGFRKYMVIIDSRIQYNIFDKTPSPNYYLGPNNELNYINDDMDKNYAHLNLYSESDMDKIADAFNIISDYCEKKGSKFYYFQCYDKESIYPEYYPSGILQYGIKSKTDLVMEKMESISANIINPKEQLIANKTNFNTYSVWGDPAHWSQRGSFVGYGVLMERINKDFENKYRILSETDFNINLKDQGEILTGCIHEIDMEEVFELKNKQAYQNGEQPLYLGGNAVTSSEIYYNDSVDNRDTVLILGDSYFEYHVFHYLAESFYKTVMVWNIFYSEFSEMLEYYKPSVVIFENAERSDKYMDIVNLAEKLQ